MTQTELFPGDEDFDRMKAKTFAAIKSRSRSRTIRHRFGAVLAFGCVAAVGTAAAVLIASAPPNVLNTSAQCYSSASLEQVDREPAPNTVAFQGNNGDTLIPLDERLSQAEILCSLSWSAGTFSEDGNIDRTKTYAVPNLVICQKSDHNLAVFPSDKTAKEVCRELGLITPRY